MVILKGKLALVNVFLQKAVSEDRLKELEHYIITNYSI